MKTFGLIGYPLGHSFSQKYFTEKFKREGLADHCYENFPLEHIGLLSELLERQADICGLNVTIPYKQQVIPFLDEVDEQALEIGAVNTIRITGKGNERKLKGFNTDVFGFERPLLKVLTKEHTSALVLGTGGASKAVAYILSRHGLTVKFVSRRPVNETILSYEQVSPELVRASKVIVNCSPLGMHPNTDSCPDIPYEALTSEHILYDLIYNPEKTLFLKKGEEKKASLLNGLPMLYIQAEEAWKIWNSDF
ncbi:MAG: shikimate dehydrogenase [Bacteroidales bacterium]|nr:shikimate dehydrogenase [Bacteroidales bacterium]